MGSRQGKVDRKRRKRQEKQQVRRAGALRHHQHLAGDTHPCYACQANEDWRDGGMVSILFAREVAPHRVTVAAFLVDTWAMGLKDAWGRIDVAVSEFEEMRDTQRQQVGLVSLEPITARHLVYGGIELARRLGFRLPRKYERWATVLGPLPEGESPDMSLFLPDGKIHLMCSAADLRARLIGSTPEEFLRRPDVEYTLGDDDFTLVDEDEDAAMDLLGDLADKMHDQIRKWCFANGQIPHPLLRQAIETTIETTLEATPPILDEDDEVPALSDADTDLAIARARSILLAESDADPVQVNAVLFQLGDFVASTDSPQAFFESLEIEP
ncbi:MAG: hypothetical protein GY778_14115 [bacterium]|nr:hypothetical protein [bacterium]